MFLPLTVKMSLLIFPHSALLVLSPIPGKNQGLTTQPSPFLPHRQNLWHDLSFSLLCTVEVIPQFCVRPSVVHNRSFDSKTRFLFLFPFYFHYCSSWFYRSQHKDLGKVAVVGLHLHVSVFEHIGDSCLHISAWLWGLWPMKVFVKRITD